ncbi:UNKNOWN [Stylonychia lemnae]|uniref:Cyclin-like domain-containing protein n=1 Tax=Stylonychia lemnae TaxID=5949 RepID=A0A078BBU0_STYLE|nr:UNKNOWN [Stylonychia lemnae]|eukprot:CDW90722.1 UNKNOWN [Stylonychia lemnae]
MHQDVNNQPHLDYLMGSKPRQSKTKNSVFTNREKVLYETSQNRRPQVKRINISSQESEQSLEKVNNQQDQISIKRHKQTFLNDKISQLLIRNSTKDLIERQAVKKIERGRGRFLKKLQNVTYDETLKNQEQTRFNKQQQQLIKLDNIICNQQQKTKNQSLIRQMKEPKCPRSIIDQTNGVLTRKLPCKPAFNIFKTEDHRSSLHDKHYSQQNQQQSQSIIQNIKPKIQVISSKNIIKKKAPSQLQTRVNESVIISRHTDISMDQSECCVGQSQDQPRSLNRVFNIAKKNSFPMAQIASKNPSHQGSMISDKREKSLNNISKKTKSLQQVPIKAIIMPISEKLSSMVSSSHNQSNTSLCLQDLQGIKVNIQTDPIMPPLKIIADEYYNYLINYEETLLCHYLLSDRLSRDFFTQRCYSMHQEIDTQLRARLLDWILHCTQVAQMEEKNIFFIICHLIDTYYQRIEIPQSKEDVQLTAISALFIASKLIQINHLSMQFCAQNLGHSKYTIKNIEDRESEILRLAEWEINSHPTLYEIFELTVMLIKKEIQGKVFNLEMINFIRDFQSIAFCILRSCLSIMNISNRPPIETVALAINLGMSLKIQEAEIKQTAGDLCEIYVIVKAWECVQRYKFRLIGDLTDKTIGLMIEIQRIKLICKETLIEILNIPRRLLSYDQYQLRLMLQGMNQYLI